MLTRLSLTVVIGLLPTVASFAEEPNSESKKLQGLWAPIAIEVSGMKLPADAPPVKESRLLIKGDRLIFNPMHPTQPKSEFGFSLDPKQTPPALNLIPQAGPAQGKSLPVAIYEWKDGQLTVCFDQVQLESGKAGDRPRAFVTRKGDGLAVYILKRVQP